MTGPIPVDVLAYAAGIIDADGTIGIVRDTWAMRHGVVCQATFTERIDVRQLEPEAVALLHQTFGGHRGVTRGKDRKQPLQRWQIGDRGAASCLTLVQPYLRIKRRQADLCLEMRRLKEESKRARFAVGRGHRGGGKRPVEITRSMERVHEEIAALNRVEGRFLGALAADNPSDSDAGEATTIDEQGP